MSIPTFTIIVYFFLCLPNFHALSTGLPYFIHIGAISCFLVVFLRRPLLSKGIPYILVVLFVLLIFATTALFRQNILTGMALAGDFGFLAKLIILLLAILLGSIVTVSYDIAKKTIMVSLVLIILCGILQLFLPTLSSIYNNSNLIQQGRIGSFGITHYEATSLSVLMCGFYLSIKFRKNELLTNWEGAIIMLTPIITSTISMSKAALIICFLWLLLSFFYFRNKKTVLLIGSFGITALVIALNQYIMVLYYGLSDLTRIGTTTNLSIITRIEDLSNFKYLFDNFNLIFTGIGPNRSSYFHYFEIGVISNLVNIGLIGTLIYYFILFCLVVSMFPRRSRMFAYLFFALLLTGDCIVNFNDGVKSLFLIGFLGTVSVVKNRIVITKVQQIKRAMI